VNTQRRPRLEIPIAAFGVALVAAGLAANQRWLDRHFLPSFFLPRQWYVLIETTVRASIAAVGVALAAARTRIAGALARGAQTAMLVLVAAGLALACSELVLRVVHMRPTEWLLPGEEPQRRPDPRLGWVLTPARTGRSVVGGRTIEYAIDAAGYRVRRVEERVDPDRPTVLFAGESVMFGEGLAWDETIPAQVGTMLGVQIANLAVHGYSNDQAYLRLEHELPRFRQPMAVVSLFMTALFGRNLDDDRPHLGPGRIWYPAERASRLASLAALLVPYRTDATVEQGVMMTRDVLHATVDLARQRSATPLIVVPQFGSEDPRDQALRRRILDEGLPYLLVTIDSGWRLPWDRHPNARAAHEVASAIAERLRQR
jgi:hypothetical protein